MRTLTPAQVARIRLSSLLLADEEPRTPLDVAQWFGALQAQDAASGQWSLGIRVSGSTASTIDESFARHHIVRTWPMRGTIHIVPADDVNWMLALTADRSLASTATRRGRLGLDTATAEHAAALLDSALAASSQLTRAECLAVLQDAGIDTEGQRGYHLLWFAAQLGVLCIGPQQGTQQTFVRLADWAPRQRQLDDESALAELGFRYFRSHGPATLKDFAGWVGLTLTSCRKAVMANGGRLVPVQTQAGESWLTAELADRIATGAVPSESLHHALPGFDEFVLGYKDRSAQVPAGRLTTIVPGGNGMFRATVAAGGVAIGIWTRRLTARTVRVDYQPFSDTATDRTAVGDALRRYADFMERDLVLGGQESTG